MKTLASQESLCCKSVIWDPPMQPPWVSRHVFKNIIEVDIGVGICVQTPTWHAMALSP